MSSEVAEVGPDEIVELGADGIGEAWPVMRQLRSHLSEEQFGDLVTEMMSDGYRLFALRRAGEIVAVAGVRVGLNLYYGRYLWVYDLVTADHVRSRGYGGRLLSALEDFARAEGCEMIALSSALQRTDAHRFYEGPAAFERAGYAFRKRLGPRVTSSP